MEGKEEINCYAFRTCDRDKGREDGVDDVSDLDLAAVKDIADAEAEEAPSEGRVHRRHRGLCAKVPLVLAHAEGAEMCFVFKIL